MHAYLDTILCKFGGDLAICLEAICTKCLQMDERHTIALAHGMRY